MGLIKSAISSIGGTLHEQWEDYITCDELDNNTLMVKKTTKTGQISAKSRIEVKPGQCAIIMDSGKILDATAEEDIYTFDAFNMFSFSLNIAAPLPFIIQLLLSISSAPSKHQSGFFS